jgi:hypothetical protein
MNQPLSPAAQAVKDAVISLYNDNVREMAWSLDRDVAAAALRAAADQVVEEPIEENFDCFNTPWGAAASIRRDILAIAAELEADRG